MRYIYRKSHFLGHPSDLSLTYPLVHENTENFTNEKEAQSQPPPCFSGSAAPLMEAVSYGSRGFRFFPVIFYSEGAACM